MARRGRFKRFFWKSVVWGIVLIIVAAVAATVGLNAVAGKMPEPKELPQPATSTVYDADGKVLAQLGGTHRIPVDCKSVSSWMPLAAMAAENDDFYNENGISYPGMARAFVTNLKSGHIEQGGSTITQQYVKNAYLSPERTYSRKLKEMALARKVENDVPKDKILCNYLNTIFFGRGASGIEAAAKQYFNKSASRLTLPEAAYIAAIIKNPGGFEVLKADAIGRRNTVLKNMFSMMNEPKDKHKVRASRDGQIWKYSPITSEMLAEAQASKPKLRSTSKLLGARASQAPYAVSLVEEYVTKKYGPDALQQGLKIKTTLNLGWQKNVDSVVAKATQGKTEPRIGATVMDTKSGAIRAMYGGPDLSKQQYDAAYDVHRQSGSTMKPVVLAQALKKGIPYTDVRDAPARITVKWGDGQKYSLENYHEASYGRVTLEKAMWSSINTVYVPLAVEVGIEDVAELAKKMGAADILIDGEKAPDVPALPSTAIGANDTNTIELATMYSTLANRGVHNAPYFIEEIKDAKGQVIEKHEAKSERVLDENIADSVNHVLRTNVENGSAQKGRINVTSAGKTGTTNDVRDMRYVGYTPTVAMSVWTGYTDNRGIPDGLAKSRTPGEIFRKSMNSFELKDASFPEPSKEIGKKKEKPTPTVKPTPTPPPTSTSTPSETPSETPTEPTKSPTPTRTSSESPTPTSTPSETKKPKPSKTPRTTETPTTVDPNQNHRSATPPPWNSETPDPKQNSNGTQTSPPQAD